MDPLVRAQSLIDQEYAELPSGKELAEKLKGKMEHPFQSPPISELEYLIQSGGCNLEDTNGDLISSLPVETARSLLFEPNDRQVELYPLLLRKLPGCNVDAGDQDSTETELARNTAASRVQPLLWALVYLVHRKSWRFLELFVLSGGFAAISETIGDENLYVRGQAIEVMLTITDCDVNDWFKKAGSDSNTRLLHTRLLSCYKDKTFLKNLILNRSSSYPGGSMRCLQILAFFLSWMRAEYSKDENLVLSNALLAAFYQWAKRKEGENVDESTDTGTDVKSNDEIELAKTLLKDFGKMESIEDVVLDNLAGKEEFVVHGLSSLAEDFLADGELFRQEFDKRLRDGRRDMIQADILDINTVIKAKDDANTLFKSKRYVDALVLYDKGLKTLENVEIDETSKADMMATLYFNKASTFWKLYQESAASNLSSSSIPSDPDDIDDIELDTSLSDKIFELQRCEQACEAALDIRPHHIKAFFRLINVIIALGRPKEALERVDIFKKTVNDDVEKEKEKILAELTRKCNASLILRSGHIHTAMESKDPDVIASTILFSGANIKPRTAKMLAKLNMRRQREDENVEHAWKDWEPPKEQSGNTAASEQTASGDDKDDDTTPNESTTMSVLKSLGLEEGSSGTYGSDNRSGSDNNKSYGGINDSDGNEGTSIPVDKDVGMGIPITGLKSKKEKTKAETKKDASNAKSKKKSEFMKMVAGL